MKPSPTHADRSEDAQSTMLEAPDDPQLGLPSDGAVPHGLSVPRPTSRWGLNPRTGLMICVGACACAALICWLQWRGLRSARSTYQTRAVALVGMQADALRISALGETPWRAADRQRPNDELLAQIERALTSAGVPLQLWQDSIPATALRLHESPYLRLGTRLYFEAVSLEQIIRFSHALLADDPSLAIPSLHLTATPQAVPGQWNADLTVSYLVYAPADTGGRD